MPERPAGPVAPERFGLLQALLAYLLAACGEETSAEIPAAELVDRFTIPAEALEEHLSLLNLVNFGGGCYAVYAELRGDTVHVDKELFGDTFRSSPRLTPLEARAIRLALEFVGPMIAAEAHRPLDKVRRKLEETFGEFDLAQTAEPRGDRDRGAADRDAQRTASSAGDSSTSSTSRSARRPSSPIPSSPTGWSGSFRTGTSTRGIAHAEMRAASGSTACDPRRSRSEKFEPREGFEPDRLRDARVARIHYSKQVARWEVERGAQPLRDGSATAEQKVGSTEWLVGEILRFRGEAVVIEPPDLRRSVARRARELLSELGLARLRVKV